MSKQAAGAALRAEAKTAGIRLYFPVHAISSQDSADEISDLYIDVLFVLQISCHVPFTKKKF